MHVLGVDTSSTNCGFVIVDGEEYIQHALWTPPKKASRQTALVDLERSCGAWIRDVHVEKGVDVAFIEEPGGGRLGFKTVRTMGQFEGVAILMCGRHDVIVRQVKASHARNILFGCKLTISKDEAHELAWERWPFLRKLGEHVTDAFVQAVAGPEAMRRGVC
jgi:Holliday junction resolvasome RuvABC endonuclease subunit